VSEPTGIQDMMAEVEAMSELESERFDCDWKDDEIGMKHDYRADGDYVSVEYAIKLQTRIAELEADFKDAAEVYQISITRIAELEAQQPTGDAAEVISNLETAAPVLREGTYWTEADWCDEAIALIQQQARYEALYHKLHDSSDKLLDRIAELEAEKDCNRIVIDRATKTIATLTERIAELEAQPTGDAAEVVDDLKEKSVHWDGFGKTVPNDPTDLENRAIALIQQQQKRIDELDRLLRMARSVFREDTISDTQWEKDKTTILHAKTRGEIDD
jgi:ribosomal protein S6